MEIEDAVEEEREMVRTGSLVEALVEGLMSWSGEGCRFREAD